ADHDVLVTGDLLVHPDAQVENRRDFAADAGTAAGRFVDAGQQPQQGRLPRAVVADEPDPVAVPQRQRDVVQRLDDRYFALGADPAADLAQHTVLQRPGFRVEDREIDVGVAHINADHRLHPIRNAG